MAGQERVPPAPKLKMTTDIPAQITTPDSVETRLGTLRFFDGFPDDATVEAIYDNLDFQRGVQAFLTAMPGASVYALREGFRSQGADNQTVLVTETLMDSKSLFLTPNSESVYNLMWLDLKGGPLVIETSPNVLGIIDKALAGNAEAYLIESPSSGGLAPLRAPATGRRRPRRPRPARCAAPRLPRSPSSTSTSGTSSRPRAGRSSP